MKKYIVQRTEIIRRTKTYEVEAESREHAENVVYESETELTPKSVYDKQIDSDTDSWEAK